MFTVFNSQISSVLMFIAECLRFAQIDRIKYKKVAVDMCVRGGKKVAIQISRRKTEYKSKLYPQEFESVFRKRCAERLYCACALVTSRACQTIEIEMSRCIKGNDKMGGISGLNNLFFFLDQISIFILFYSYLSLIHCPALKRHSYFYE